MINNRIQENGYLGGSREKYGVDAIFGTILSHELGSRVLKIHVMLHTLYI